MCDPDAVGQMVDHTGQKSQVNSSDRVGTASAELAKYRTTGGS